MQWRKIAADRDVEGPLIYSPKSHDVVGVYYSANEPQRVYFDQDRKQFQHLLDRVLKERHNYIVGFSQNEQRYIVYSSVDQQSGAYFLGDRAKNKLGLLFHQKWM